MTQQPKLLDKVREMLRLKHYSPKTEDTYVNWIRRFIRFHHMRHPREMREPEIQAYLTHLAVNENVAASTQHQAFSALLFLYREVLNLTLDPQLQSVRAAKPKHLPTVLTKQQVTAILSHMSGVTGLMARLLYGSGLRRWWNSSSCCSPSRSNGSAIRVLTQVFVGQWSRAGARTRLPV